MRGVALPLFLLLVAAAAGVWRAEAVGYGWKRLDDKPLARADPVHAWRGAGDAVLLGGVGADWKPFRMEEAWTANLREHPWTWQRHEVGGDVPEARLHPVWVELDGTVHLFGGFSSAVAEDDESRSELHFPEGWSASALVAYEGVHSLLLDPPGGAAMAWETTPASEAPLPDGASGRALASSASHAGAWFVVGGFVGAGADDEVQPCESVWRYRPGTGWDAFTTSDGVSGVFDAQLAVIGGQLLAFGGFLPSKQARGAIDRLDVSGGAAAVAGASSWVAVGAVTDAAAVAGAAVAVTADGRFVQALGHTTSQVDKGVAEVAVLNGTAAAAAEGLTQAEVAETIELVVDEWDINADGGTFSRPRPIAHAASLFDSATGLLYVMHGHHAGLEQNVDSVFVLNVSSPSVPPAWLPVSGNSFSVTPGGRRNAATAPSPDGAFVALFGGKDADRGFHNDLWLLNVATRTWRLVFEDVPDAAAEAVQTVPGPRDEACIFWVDQTTIVMYGGDDLDEDDVVSALFNLTTGTWTVLQRKLSSARTLRSHTCEADREGGRALLLFGALSSTSFGLENDLAMNLTTFELDVLPRAGAATDAVGNAVVPGARVNAFSVLWNRSVWVFGGTLESTRGNSNEAWRLDLDTDTWTLEELAYDQGSLDGADPAVLPSVADFAVAMVGHRALLDVGDVALALDLRERTAVRLDRSATTGPWGSVRLEPRDRHNLASVLLAPAAGGGSDGAAAVMSFGNSALGLGLLPDSWLFSFDGYCQEFARVVQPSATTGLVAVVSDNSRTARYVAGSDCWTELVAGEDDEDGDDAQVNLSFVELDLGDGDTVSVYDGDAVDRGAPDPARLLRVFVSGDAPGDAIRPTMAHGNALTVRFVSDDDPDTVGRGFAAVSADACQPGTFGDPVTGTCRLCEPGTYAAGSGTLTCTPCEAGFFSESEGAVNCTLCGAGNRRVSTTECLPCQPGTFAGSSGEVATFFCDLCDSSSYAPGAGSTSCERCPANSWTGYFGADTMDACRCREGFVLASLLAGASDADGADPCVECPAGAECAGGDAAPAAQAGFFFDERSGVHVRCQPFEACAGAGQCSPLYTGERCSRCADGAVRLERECGECPSKAKSWLYLTLVVLLAAAMLTALVWFYTSPGNKPRVLGSLAIVIDNMQIMWLFSLLDIDWPAETEGMFRFAGLTMLDANLTRPGCAVEVSWFAAWRVKVFTPFMVAPCLVAAAVLKYALERWSFRFFEATPVTCFAAVLARCRRAAVCLCMCCRRKPSASAAGRFSGTKMVSNAPGVAGAARRHPTPVEEHEELKEKPLLSYLRQRLSADQYHLWGALNMFMSVAYAHLATNSVQFFACTEEANGESYLNDSPDVRCFSDEWYSHLPLALVALVIYPVGIPVYFVLRLPRVANLSGPHDKAAAAAMAASDPQAIIRPRDVARFGRLVYPFIPRLYNWTVVLMVRKLVIIAIHAFSLNRIVVTTTVLLFVLSTVIVAEAALLPYRFKYNNLVEMVIGCSLFLVLLFGFLFFSDLSKEQDPGQKQNITGALVTILVIVYVAAVAGLVHEVYKTYLSRLRSRAQGTSGQGGAAAAAGGAAARSQWHAQAGLGVTSASASAPAPACPLPGRGQRGAGAGDDDDDEKYAVGSWSRRRMYVSTTSLPGMQHGSASSLSMVGSSSQAGAADEEIHALESRLAGLRSRASAAP